MSLKLNSDVLLTETLDKLAIENFRQYLRIPSVHPNINYDDCVKFLEKLANSLDLPFNVFIPIPTKPIVIITWMGEEPNLPAILLNSHMDVVPVFEDQWTHKPFDADIDDEGNIYGRGTQDVKCIGIQYLEAVRRLKLNGFKPRRTIHVSFVPDEETGGEEGMLAFIQTSDFKKLNLGFALDEGTASNNSEYWAYYGERYWWQFGIHIPRKTGHSSLLMDDTSGEKIQYILNKFYEFRKTQRAQLHELSQLGTFTTLNLTMLQVNNPSVYSKGGVASEFVLSFDNRNPITVGQKEWEHTIEQWCKEAGEDVWIETYKRDVISAPTKIDESNEYWMAFKKAVKRMEIKLVPLILAGGTDGRFLRELGIPTIGFSPNRNTPKRTHGNDEFLNVDVFLQGVRAYCEIISEIANC